MVERVGAIIQARRGSSRLPNKVLKVLPSGFTVIESVISRVNCVKGLDLTVVAMPNEDKDSQLSEQVINSGTETFFGPNEDVLSRFYYCAKKYMIDVVVRITADDPVKDPRIIEQGLVLLLNNQDTDYVTSNSPPTFPEGMDIEVFRFRALERAYYEAKLSSEREHVTPYIWKNPLRFNIKTFSNTSNVSNIRLTLDTAVDWELISQIDKVLYRTDRFYCIEDILNYLERHPEFVNINRHIERNYGYKKSLINDRFI